MSTEKPGLKKIYSSLFSLNNDLRGKIYGLQDNSLISSYVINYIKDCCKFLSWGWDQEVLDDLQSSIYTDLIKNLEYFSENNLQIPDDKRNETAHLLLNVCLIDIDEDFSYKNEIITYLKGKCPNQQDILNNINQCKNSSLSHLEDEHFKDRPANQKALDIKRRFKKNVKIPPLPYHIPILEASSNNFKTPEKKNPTFKLPTSVPQTKTKPTSDQKKQHNVNETAVPVKPSNKTTSPKRKLSREDESETHGDPGMFNVDVFENVKKALIHEEINTSGSSKISNVYFPVNRKQDDEGQGKVNICLSAMRKALYKVVGNKDMDDSSSSSTISNETQADSASEEGTPEIQHQQYIFLRQDLIQNDVVTPESPEKSSSSTSIRDSSSQQSRPYIFPRQDLLPPDVSTQYSNYRRYPENNSNSINQRKPEKKKTDPLILPVDTSDVHVEPSDVHVNTCDVQVETRNSSEGLPENPSGSNMEPIDSIPYNYNSTLDDLLNSLSFRQTAEEPIGNLLPLHTDEERSENNSTLQQTIQPDPTFRWGTRNDTTIQISGHHRPYVSTRPELVPLELRMPNLTNRPGSMYGTSPVHMRNHRHNSSSNHHARKSHPQKIQKYPRHPTSNN